MIDSHNVTAAEPGSMASEDEDDDFPVTPNSKRSRASGKQRAADSPGFPYQESTHTFESNRDKHTKLYHPYRHRSRPLAGEIDDRAEHILRRHSCIQYSEGMSIEVRRDSTYIVPT
jgi:hypothetical protein